MRTDEAATEFRGEVVAEGGGELGSLSESELFSTDDVVEVWSSEGRDEARKNGRGGDNGEGVRTAPCPLSESSSLDALYDWPLVGRRWLLRDMVESLVHKVEEVRFCVRLC